MLGMFDHRISSLKCFDWEFAVIPRLFRPSRVLRKLLHSPKLRLPLLAIDHKAWLIN